METEWNPAAFSAWLKERLRLREMSPADLARATGVRNGTVSRWLNGRRPEWGYCERIADALALPTTDVLAAAGYPAEATGIDPDDPTERVVAKLRRARLDPLWLQAVEAQIDVFLEHRRAERRAARGQS